MYVHVDGLKTNYTVTYEEMWTMITSYVYTEKHKLAAIQQI